MLFAEARGRIAPGAPHRATQAHRLTTTRYRLQEVLTMAVEMVVESIRMNLLYPHRVVMLKEVRRERYLPIVIGVPEADAIAIKLQNHEVPRPLTHDLLCNMIGTLGARVTKVVVNDLSGETFFARIIMDVAGRHVEVDSRPSDAIALAVRLGVPIFVEESVLERGAIEPEECSERER